MANITFNKKSIVLVTIELTERSDPDRVIHDFLEFLGREKIEFWIVSSHSGLGTYIFSFEEGDVVKVESWLLGKGAERG